LKRSPDLAPLWRNAQFHAPTLPATDFSADDRQVLEEAGLLRDAGVGAFARCPHCPDAAAGPVEHETLPDGSTRHFVLCAECGFVILRREHFSGCAPAYGGIVRRLSDALGMARPAEEIEPSLLWKMGQAGFDGKTRHVWAGRALEQIPEAKRPEAGVLFTMGFVPESLLHRDIIRVPVEDVCFWDQGLQIDAILCEAAVAASAVLSEGPKRKAPSKRAGRINLIARLTRYIQNHIRSQQKWGLECFKSNTLWKLAPLPGYRVLAGLFDTSISNLSKAFNDKDAKMLVFVRGIAEDEEKVLDYRG